MARVVPNRAVLRLLGLNEAATAQYFVSPIMYLPRDDYSLLYLSDTSHDKMDRVVAETLELLDPVRHLPIWDEMVVFCRERTGTKLVSLLRNGHLELVVLTFDVSSRDSARLVSAGLEVPASIFDT